MPRRPGGDGIRHPYRPFPLAILLGVCLAAGACSTSSVSPSPLVVVAPVTLQVPLLAVRPAVMGRHPAWEIDFNFLAQPSPETVRAATPDLVATADNAAMAQLVQSGLVEAPHLLAHDLLEIAVPSANPHRITGLTDLARTGLRVAVVDASAPTGQQTRRVLTAANVQLVSLAASDPAAALDLVAIGAADAALVETSDFKAAPPGLRSVAVTPVTTALVSYEIAVVRDSAHLQAAQGLENELLGAGQTGLRDHGFLSP